MKTFFPRIGEIAQANVESLGLLLLLSGVFGAALGITTATWQSSLETSQFLAGLVHYSPASPSYAYNTSNVSLVNYVGAVFLMLTNSEIASSLLLCGMLGALALQTMAMAVFLSARNVYLAVFASLMIVEFHLYGSGISYPIILLGSPHTFGRVGLMFTAMAALFFGHSRWRTAFFLSGLSLAVHPAWGLWLNACLFVVFTLRWREFRPLLSRDHLLSYGLGVGISLSLFVLQRLAYPAFPLAVGNAQNARELFLNYIRYWDFHRSKFSNPVVLGRELTHAGLALILSVALWKTSRAEKGVRYFAIFLAVTTLVGAVFIFVPSWFDPAAFPAILVILMPGRFINIAILVAFPLLVGLVLRERRTVPGLMLLFFAWYVCWRFLGRFPIPIPPPQTGLLLLAGILFVWRQRFEPRTLGGAYSPKLTALMFATVATLLLFSPIYVLTQRESVEKAFVRVDLPSRVPGAVLTTVERYLLQSESRVPTISPNTDGYVYSPDAFVRAAPLFLDLFAIDFRLPPEPGIRHGKFGTNLYAASWEARDCREWERLGREYGFGAILVPGDMTLKLPKVNQDRRWNVYFARCPGM